MAYTFNTELKSVAVAYAKLLRPKVTFSSIKRDIEEHPYYPSLLALSDTFNKYNISNNAYRVRPDEFEQYNINAPFIAYMKLPEIGSDFVLVTSISENTINYIYKGNRVEILSKEAFLSSFNGVIWLAELNTDSGEEEYDKKLKEENKKKYANVSLLIASISIVILLLTVNIPTNYLLPFLLITVIKIIGLGTSILLLIYEIDKNNSFVKNVCSRSTKTNCNAILGSDAAKIWGISWGEIGFFYFASTIVGLLLPNLTFEVKKTLVAITNTCVVPYIFFSIFYQYKIAKQWCPLCLIVQLVLFLEFLWSTFFVWQYPLNSILSISSLISGLFCIIVPVTIWYSTKITFIKAHDYNIYKAAYRRLQYNPEVFNTLLIQEPQAPYGWQYLGIDLGNQNAKNTIIKICNPYCTPCDKAHLRLEGILSNNDDVKLKIIYITRNNDYDPGRNIVKHLLAIADKKDGIKTKKALDDWYTNVGKDYKKFSNIYPVNEELNQQNIKIEGMSHWCNIADITHTPTIFVNGYRLPENYKIEDLKYIL